MGCEHEVRSFVAKFRHTVGQGKFLGRPGRFCQLTSGGGGGG